MRVRQYTVNINGKKFAGLLISAEPGSNEVGESFTISLPDGIKTFKSIYWFSQWAKRRHGWLPICEMGEYILGPTTTEWSFPENFPTVEEWEEYENQSRHWLENQPMYRDTPRVSLINYIKSLAIKGFFFCSCIRQKTASTPGGESLAAVVFILFSIYLQ